MFAGPILLIPLYKVLRTLGLLNTYQAMIVPGVAFLIPTSIWLLKSYFQKVALRATYHLFSQKLPGFGRFRKSIPKISQKFRNFFIEKIFFENNKVDVPQISDPVWPMDKPVWQKKHWILPAFITIQLWSPLQ